MNTLIPGAPLRSLSPTTNEYQRAEGESRAAKPARVARFSLDAPEHSGTIPGARGDILTPGVALTSNLAVIFTLNQHRPITDKHSTAKGGHPICITFLNPLRIDGTISDQSGDILLELSTVFVRSKDLVQYRPRSSPLHAVCEENFQPD